MPRQRSPKRDLAYQLWLDSGKTRKFKDIAAELNVSESQVRKWKNQDNWNGNVTSQTNSNVTIQSKGNVTDKKTGAPKGNRNAAGNKGGAPLKNTNAEKFGFFRKYLPEETVSIIEEMPEDPLDVLWDQIQIAYAAIIRAQKIMYVENRDDMAKEVMSDGEQSTTWDVQQAWDRQANFLSSQARAQSELRGMIGKYDELLRKNSGLATEEQKMRIEKLKAETMRIRGEDTDEKQDDGFIEALQGQVKDTWED